MIDQAPRAVRPPRKGVAATALSFAAATKDEVMSGKWGARCDIACIPHGE